MRKRERKKKEKRERERERERRAKWEKKRREFEKQREKEREREREKEGKREKEKRVRKLRNWEKWHLVTTHIGVSLSGKLKLFLSKKKLFLGSTTKYFYLPLITPTRMMIMMVRVEPK